MPNLRDLAERDLSITLEGDWAGNIKLFPPDGVPFTVKGQVLYNLARLDPMSGEKVTLSTLVVTVRRSSCRVVPQPGENWLVELPVSPQAGAPVGQYISSGDRPPEGGAAIGFIRLYLQEVEQSEESGAVEDAPNVDGGDAAPGYQL